MILNTTVSNKKLSIFKRIKLTETKNIFNLSTINFFVLILLVLKIAKNTLISWYIKRKEINISFVVSNSK